MVISERVRLHISPFNPDICRLVIPSSSASHAENISYHTLQTFPEKSYGFLELSQTEADKMKKKLNGSILKGKKVRVEEARPRKRTRMEANDDLKSTERHTDKVGSALAPSSTPADLEGHELPTDRKVKRGWTEPKRKDRKRKAGADTVEVVPSKYSEQEECLFRTQLPPNWTNTTDKSSIKKKTGAKDGRKAVIHEFERSTAHPTFLRRNSPTSQDPTTASFIDGKGWIDQSGKLVEEGPKVVSQKLNTSNGDLSPVPENSEPQISKATQGSRTITGIASDKHSKGSKISAKEDAPAPTSTSGFKSIQQDADDTSSEGTSSDLETGAETSSDSEASSQSAKDKTLDPPQVHPLEALFKRNQSRTSGSASKPSLEIKTSFNFFGPEAGEGPEPTIPATPFTRKDMHLRGQRSAAPTPDTAAPTKATFSRSDTEPRRAPTTKPVNGDNNESDPPSETQDPNSAGPEGGKDESSFTKWFWENRGDNNRTWKRLRREAAKEKRQTENRRSKLGRE